MLFGLLPWLSFIGVKAFYKVGTASLLLILFWFPKPKLVNNLFWFTGVELWTPLWELLSSRIPLLLLMFPDPLPSGLKFLGPCPVFNFFKFKCRFPLDLDPGLFFPKWKGATLLPLDKLLGSVLYFRLSFLVNTPVSCTLPYNFLFLLSGASSLGMLAVRCFRFP
jgi:hypothetical protein